ncbi:MAG: hypothetical protein QM485_05435 [Flavobacteriaceae bacterium]
MKKAASIFAVVMMCIGMFSCQPESSVEETQALYDLQDTNSGGDQYNPTDERE